MPMVSGQSVKISMLAPFRFGDRQIAEASFKKAINASSNSVGARVALAHYYRSQNRDADAETTLKEAAHIDTRNVQVNSNLVELYIRTGRPREAASKN